MKISPSVKTQYSKIPPCCFIDSSRKINFSNGGANSVSRSCSFHQMKGRRLAISCNSNESRPISQQELEISPLSMELVPISSEAHFDRVVAESQHLDESVVILWMASWCRKCIFLKPKLEKLAADYHPRVRFYSVDVNSVPHKLVVRAEVTKMPTIQLWRDGKKQEEVIGGHHKAYLVVYEVREIIENEIS
ncbi:hypothetical protein SASPL_136868 [Salvia splendens]|uniref:Thioredoxin domain-containing protein n=1 Tax=Salvia splendens TaxID=180675 RepID=A0A8X8X1E2_SALSN|nr:thioredoxin-like 3-2, chloroplastic [Salvia splendens]KAG6404617.1 hypothetical protein SASPL_136868 [Salvia splendens]